MTVEIAALNSQKFNQINQIVSLGQAYAKYVNEIVMSLNKDEMNSYDVAIKYLIDAAAPVDALIASLDKTILGSAHALYDIYARITYELANIRKVVANPNYSKMAMYNFSGTTLNTIVLTRNQLIELIDNYTEIDVDSDSELIKHLINKINVGANIKTVLIFLMDTPSTNRFVVDLVKVAVTHTSGTNRDKLLSIIEREKDKIFSARRVKLPYGGVQGLVVRCGLVPVTSSMEFKQLLEIINNVQLDAPADTITGGGTKRAIKTAKTAAKYTKRQLSKDKLSKDKLPSDKSTSKDKPKPIDHVTSTFMLVDGCIDECFEHLAKINSMCVLLINKCTPNPIEFNINGLISTEYVEKYDLRARVGSCIDEKVLKRYNTVSELQPGVTAPSELQIWGQGDFALVFETINGKLFKLLSNDINKYVTPTYLLKPFIAGVNNRLLKYNLLHENEILSKYIDPKAGDTLASYQKTTAQFPIENALRDAREKLNEAFAEKITSYLPKSLQEFKEFIDKDKITSILTGVFLKYLPAAQNPEYAITYIVRFEDGIRAFNKEIDTNMRHAKVTDLSFRERSPNDLRRFLIDSFGDIVRISMDQMQKTKKFDDIEISLKEFYMDNKNI